MKLLKKQIIKIVRQIFLLGLFSICMIPALAEDPVIITLEPDQFYFQPDVEQLLTFQAYSRSISQEELDFKVFDLYGNEVLSGTAHTTDNIKANALVTLPQGYYRLYFPALETYFGLTVLPFRDREFDRFFGVQGSLSTTEDLSSLSFVDRGIRFESLVKTLKKTGIGIVRERLRPASFSPSRGVFEYDPPGHRYEDVRVMFEKYDIHLLGFFAITPWWMRRDNDRLKQTERHNRFPVDMHGITNTWDSIANRWEGVLQKIEIWNEPRSGTQDRLAPIYHAMAYSFAGNEYPKILGSGFTVGNMGKYIPDLCKMGAVQVMDELSFHQYMDPDATALITNNIRDNLKDFGLESMPVFNSESGVHYMGGSWPSFEQDLIGAGNFAGRVAENKAYGQEHFFQFLYTPKIPNEYDKQQSNICVSGTGQLRFAAYLHSALLLSHRSYIGDFSLDHSALAETRVFADTDTAVVTLYRNDKDLVTLPETPLKVFGIDGRPLELQKGKLSLEDPMVYLVYLREDIEPFLDTQNDAMENYMLAEKSYEGLQNPVPVSVLHVPDYMEMEFSNSAYLMNNIIDKSANLYYRAYNLSESDQTIEMELSLPDWLSTDETLTKSIMVPAGDYASFSWKVTFNSESDGFLGEVWIRPTQTSENKVHPLMFRVQCQRPLEGILDDFRSYRKLYLYNSSKWREYARNQAEIDVNVQGDTVDFQVMVSDEKDWMAGTYNVSDVDFTHVKGFFADARLDKKPSNGKRFWPNMQFGFLEGGEGGQYFSMGLPPHGERTWVYAELDDISIDLNDINQNLDRDQIVDFRVRFQRGVPDVEVDAELYAIYLVSDTLLFSDTLFDARVTLLNKQDKSPLKGVEVLFEDDTLITDNEGEVLFEDYPYGYYDIKAEAEGFYPNVNLSYIELHQDTSFVFELQKDLPDVTINFTDAQTGEAIQSVEVSWEGQVSNSSVFGSVELRDISGDSLKFTADHDDYFHVTDTIIVNADTAFEVEMQQRYADLAFRVSDEDGNIGGAIVSNEDRVEVTNPSGIVNYYDLSVREMYTYTIDADGYQSYKDSVYLETDTLITVLLIPVHNKSAKEQANFRVYPNPAGDVLHIEAKDFHSSGKIRIYDLLGKVVMECLQREQMCSVDLRLLDEGAYFLQANYSGDVYSERIFIIR